MWRLAPRRGWHLHEVAGTAYA